MELSNLFGYGLATVGTVAIALSPGVEKSSVEASNNNDQKNSEFGILNSELKTNNSELRTPNYELPLPCLDSGKECVEQLTESAIANSPKLKTLDERIALIDERLELMGDRIGYAQDRRWTNYITIDPVKLVQNIFGGGDIQRDRIAIADLEVKSATLEAARAELERQREEEKILLGEKVLRLVLDYESSDRRVALIQSQLQSFNVSREVFRIRYRLGQGTNEQWLGFEERSDRLADQLVEAQTKRDEAVRELAQVTGYESITNPSNK